MSKPHSTVIHRTVRLVTHCPSGHEYTPENTASRKVDGSRRCKQCDRDYANAYLRAKRERHAEKGRAA